MPDRATSSHAVLEDLRKVFGPRLTAFVVYAPGRVPQPSLAVVSSLTFDDLAACARFAPGWHRADLATPILLPDGEFGRSLDAFPVEFGEIIATHTTLAGSDPFTGLHVAPADLRRACEAQVRSLLLHLREDYVEAAAEPAAVTALVVHSAPEFRTVLGLLARLDDHPRAEAELATWATERLGLDRTTVTDLVRVAASPAQSGVDAVQLFPAYLAATETLARRIDEWT